MKKVVFCITILLFIFSFRSQEKQEIEFYEGTWQEVLEAARRDEQLIFVDCYATWCGPCKYMSKVVFTDSTVVQLFNQKFLNYQLNMETPQGEAFAKKYPIKGYPTMFFLNPKGDIILQIEGKHTVQQLLREANKAVQKSRKM